MHLNFNIFSKRNIFCCFIIVSQGRNLLKFNYLFYYVFVPNNAMKRTVNNNQYYYKLLNIY